jgi:type IV pilus modification protein PilV
MSTNHKQEPRRGARDGFTLVELLVAVVILAVGVLGLAATASVVTRQMTGAVHQSVAANVAYSRMERIRTGNCVAMADSSSPAAGVVTRNVRERWVIAKTNNAILVYDTITYVVRGRKKTQVYHSEFPCTAL